MHAKILSALGLMLLIAATSPLLMDCSNFQGMGRRNRGMGP